MTEDLELLPLSEYNKTKMCGERIVLSYKDDMAVQIVRPATVCGYSPRHAARCVRQHADDAGVDERAHHGVRRRADAVPISTSTTSPTFIYSCSIIPSIPASTTPGSRTSRSWTSRGW